MAGMYIMPLLKLLVFIFHAVTRAHLAQISDVLLRYPSIVISTLCGACSGLNQGELMEI